MMFGKPTLDELNNVHQLFINYKQNKYTVDVLYIEAGDHWVKLRRLIIS
jgi:hypothetical protein